MYLRILPTLLLCFVLVAVSAQELLLPIEANHIALPTGPSKKNDHEPLKLPLFDDFSYPGPAPKTDLWEPSHVSVGMGYAQGTVSVGAASFDCLNAQGGMFGHLDYFDTFGADTLQSRSIDLSGASTVYLSFLYQGGGHGPAPSATDTLVLQFYAKAEGRWISVWRAEGAQHTEFQEAWVRVSQTRFYTDDFRFRFINYVSLGRDDKPTLRGNADVWNLDYVYLAANRTEGEYGFDDIAFRHAPPSLLRGLQSVPWRHYLANPTQLMSDRFSVSILNYGASPKNINELNFVFTDLWGDGSSTTIRAGSYDLLGDELFEREFPNNTFFFRSTNADSAAFLVRNEMLLDRTDYWAPNNAAERLQVFTDYYAYDDGTAEAGYGILGNGSSNAQVAYQFDNQLVGDALWGVDIFFTRTLNAANLKYFYLMVWADSDGQPGEVLYRQPLSEDLKYANGLGRFNSFRLHVANSAQDTAVVVPQRFYIGWEQTTEGLLGVGLDRANAANERLFYNVSNRWAASQIEGALMMRPVFRQRPQSTTDTERPQQLRVQLFPNPASELLHLRLEENLHHTQLEVWDLTGRLLLQQTALGQETSLPIHFLQPGTYLLRVLAAGKSPASFRFVKQ